MLGIFYAFGQGVTKDEREAASWYRKAAEQGNSASQVSLANAHAAGNGVPQDFVEAYKWADLAAANGRVLRDEIATKMTSEQIAEAQRMAAEFVPKKEGEKTASPKPEK